MLKKSVVLPLIVLCYWTEVNPASLGALKYDLDTKLDDLKYDVEEEDLDDYYDTLDDGDAEGDSGTSNNNDKTKVSGFKKISANDRGFKSKHNVQDLKKFLKAIGIKDDGTYSNDEIYAAVQGIAAEAVGTKGKEVKKYRKGTKTRGFHRVHHKDEYKKDKEFYDDDETRGSIQKVGGKLSGFKLGGGAGFDKGHFHRDHQKGVFGKQGYLDKGFRNNQYSGYSDAQDFDVSFNKES